MKIFISRVVLLSFMLLTGLEPFAHTQATQEAQNLNHRLRPLLRYENDQQASQTQTKSLSDEMRMVSNALNANPLAKESFSLPSINLFPILSSQAKLWLKPLSALVLLIAAVPALDSIFSKAEAKEAENKAPAEETGSLVTRDYPLGISGTLLPSGAYGVDAEWRSSITDATGTWAYRIKGALYDSLKKDTTESVAPAYKTLKLSLKRIWDQEHKPFIGGGLTYQTPINPELQEIFLGLGGNVWNRELGLPLLGVTTINHDTEFWLNFRKDLNTLRVPIMEKFNVESKELSLTAHAGYEPGSQKWIGFVQGWRNIGVFNGWPVDFGYAMGWNSADYHHYIFLPTDSERFSIIVHFDTWDAQYDFYKDGSHGLTFDFFRQKPAPPAAPDNNPFKKDPKKDKSTSDGKTGNSSSSGENKSSGSTGSNGLLDKNGLTDGAAAGIVGGSFFAFLRRKIEVILKTILRPRLNIVFVEELSQAETIAKSTMAFYHQDETVLFVVKDMDILMKMEPFLVGRDTLAHIDKDGSIFKSNNGFYTNLRLEPLEQVLPELLKEKYKTSLVPYILKNAEQNLDFPLSTTAILSKENIFTMDIKDLIDMVMNLKVFGVNLLQWNPVREMAIVLTSA